MLLSRALSLPFKRVKPYRRQEVTTGLYGGMYATKISRPVVEAVDYRLYRLGHRDALLALGLVDSAMVEHEEYMRSFMERHPSGRQDVPGASVRPRPLSDVCEDLERQNPVRRFCVGFEIDNFGRSEGM